MLKVKEVKCIDNSGNEETLTLFKNYTCKNYDDEMVAIIDDSGKLNWYCIDGFEFIHKTKVTIIVNGGVVQQIYASDQNVDITVIDIDDLLNEYNGIEIDQYIKNEIKDMEIIW